MELTGKIIAVMEDQANTLEVVSLLSLERTKSNN